MSDVISPETFEHLVELAALELKEQEGDYLRQQLNNQLKVIHELAAIPIDEQIPPTFHGTAYTEQISPQLRSDEWVPYPEPGEILQQAPQGDDGYFIVPDIPHTDLK